MHLVKFRYQLVIMDVSIVESYEFWALKKVREFAAIPIWAISTNGESNHIVQTLAIADDYLKKPIDMKECTAKVQALVCRFAYESQQNTTGVPCRDGMDSAQQQENDYTLFLNIIKKTGC